MILTGAYLLAGDVERQDDDVNIASVEPESIEALETAIRYRHQIRCGT